MNSEFYNTLSKLGTFFTYETVKEAISSDPKDFIRMLIRKGIALKVGNGFYCILPTSRFGSKEIPYSKWMFHRRIKRSYISHGGALTFYGLCDQNYDKRIVSVPPDAFVSKTYSFLDGTEFSVMKNGDPDDVLVFPEQVQGGEVLVTDKTRTIIDCFSKPDLCGNINNAIDAFRNLIISGEFSFRRLKIYLEATGIKKMVGIKRLLVVAEGMKYRFTEEEYEYLFRFIQKAKSRNYYFNPLLKTDNVYDKRYGIFISKNTKL